MDVIDRREVLPIEEKIAQVDQWVGGLGTNLDKEGNVVVPELDQTLLREVLTYFGANFEVDSEANPERVEQLGKLRQKTNKHRRPV